MKLNRFSIIALGALTVVSCSDIDEQFPEGGILTSEQIQETTEAIPERTEATFTGMYNMMGESYSVFPSSGRADDWGIPMIMLSLDGEGPDMWMANNNYNWFSTCGEFSSRNANYANPYIRYILPYRQIGIANEVLASISPDTEDQNAIYKMAQARAIRAYDYMLLAPYFQFNYETSKDKPCIPVLKDGVDYANNPRATVEEVYNIIIEDLNYAVEHLEGYERASKAYVNLNVAYGLRARAYLNMGMYAEAAADAAKAIEGYNPATMDELAAGPRFCKADETNWMWGVVITDDQAKNGGLATPASWFSAFTGDGYAPATQVTPSINSLLYNKIPATDVRKAWWIDTNLYSPLLDKISWNGVTGVEISKLVLDDGSKVAYAPYTNVKFGMKSGIGSPINSNDFPLMRVEEMILVEIEGLAKSGQESAAKTKLESFVKTYRDPNYTVEAGGRTLDNEIWYQRRVELWGEGFATSDMMRLNKPLVRFHDNNPGSFPDAHAFNMPANDPWRLLRFPQTEMNTNAGIIDNEGGEQPVPGQNAGLRDGVTD
jgi:tetratricopeptide (TPR) repeat protein